MTVRSSFKWQKMHTQNVRRSQVLHAKILPNNDVDWGILEGPEEQVMPPALLVEGTRFDRPCSKLNQFRGVI